ncbi:uncharacterized protein LOC134831505 [Culicoides brevitarsis]|uniref:uncharacterized protein LOC134831505 n=1 Tax=Culicoides brevitarsis TaxID=469753 RepID=UPI00307CA749
MARYNWLYRKVRKYMQPVDFDVAEKWKKRLSLIYFLCAWNAIAFIGFQYYRGKGDWAKAAGLKTEGEEKIPVAAQYANVLGIKNAHVTRISGLKKSAEYEIVDGEVRFKDTNDQNESISS